MPSCLPGVEVKPFVIALLTCTLGVITSTHVWSAAPFSIDVDRRSCRPGEVTRLNLTGKQIDESTRVVTSNDLVQTQIESAESGKATIALSIPSEISLGPFRVWVATRAGIADPLVLLIDDLPITIDNGQNHTRETAQEIPPLHAIEGISDGAKSDFYCLTVQAGQRLAVEVRTEAIESAMDPVVRLTDANGRQLFWVDDAVVGPECRFGYQFKQSGQYFLEVSDSRFASGDAYHLRVGDFPLLSHCDPLAVQRGESTTIEFATLDSNSAKPMVLEVPAASQARAINVRARLHHGKSSAWAPLQVCDTTQVSEAVIGQSTTKKPLSIPIGITGKLSEPGEVDQYAIQGVKDKRVLIRSRTRSLGCASLLRLELFDEDGGKVAETTVSELDEWEFEYRFPKDGQYLLKASDLLGRGGDAFGYWIELTPQDTFSITLKADAKTPQQFVIEEGTGAAAIDLEIARDGYEGELELSLRGDVRGLRMVNPRIRAKAKAAKVYMAADKGWDRDSLAAITLAAHAKGDPNHFSRLDGLAVHRAKKPHAPFAFRSDDGILTVSGAERSAEYFEIQPLEPIQFARPARQHPVDLKLVRTDKAFKTDLKMLTHAFPTGWRFAVKAEKDTYKTHFTRVGAAPPELATLPLKVFSEFQGRGRITSLDLPIEWIDPIKVSLEFSGPLVAGTKSTAVAKVEREGSDAQPVEVRLVNLPEGVSAREAITLAADQSRGEIQLEVSPEVVGGMREPLQYEATSKYQGVEFTVSDQTAPVQVVSLPTTIDVFPSEIDLVSSKDRQQLVVTGNDAAEIPRDWTGDLQFSVTDSRVAEMRGSVVHPLSNGSTTVVVGSGSLRRVIPIRVTGFELPRRTQFESEVLVSLSKQGCNSGACHGSPSGKGGFRLSLRAFDRTLDELTLIREDFGRRINRIEPERSLLLLKPLMNVSHGGGKKLHRGDDAYAILESWIAEGAGTDPVDTPRCVRLEVFPGNKRLLEYGFGGQQLCVTAHFADGASRDVTHLVAYESSNVQVATVNAQGYVSAKGRGESVILVRFLEHIESVPVTFVHRVPDFRWTAPPAQNFVDQLVDDKLRQMQILPSKRCSDSEFLRRVTLDVIGILPTVQESETFLASQRPRKREEWIDHLLGRDEFAKFWALKWGDLLEDDQRVGWR